MRPIESEVRRIIRGRQHTVESLVRALQAKGFSFESAVKAVYVMSKRGEIELLEPRPPRSLLGYMLSLRAAWYWMLMAYILATLLLVSSARAPPLVYLRYVLGSLFVLYTPGATLIEALYPRGTELDPLERLALSIGLSLAVVPLIGLVLNYTPWGIRLKPVSMSLAAFTALMATIAVARKYSYYSLENLT